ncbi:hypothetical protein [Neptuniibacter sp. QD48_11]|uniref:hypothetical protein n=1 Tax=Neptuniibacter sp. QD48_11 TaxID=3398211 RepID=UPI0039F577BA
MIYGSNVPMAEDYSDLRALDSESQATCRELIYMKDQFIALTDSGVYAVQDNTLTNQVLDVCFGAGDVFGSWSLEIGFHINSDREYWKEYNSLEAEPEFLLPITFYDALADLEATYPEQKETVLQVLIALYGARTFYANWDKEDCWARAMTFYTLDQAEVAA